MSRKTVTPRIIEENEKGFSGTNSQWAELLGVSRQSTYVALQRLVVQGLIERVETSEGATLYGHQSNAVRLNGKRVIVSISPSGKLSVKWG